MNDSTSNEQLADQLAAAFSYFNANTEKLTVAYNKLEQEVARINDELENKNNQLQQKIGEVDHVRSYLENILQSMATAVVAVDLHMSVTVINRCAGELLDIDPKSYIGAPVDRLLCIDKMSSSEMRAMITADTSRAEREVKIICNNRDLIDAGISSSPIYNSKDENIGYLLLMRDLREIKKLQEKARRADRLVALGEMAARVAHEIRNPLGGIEGFASLLVRILESDKESQRLASYIMEGVQSVNHIVSSLLDYARPVHIKKSFFSLREIIYDVCDQIHASSNGEKKNIKIMAEFACEKNPVLFADKILTQQIIWNLLVNGVQSMNRPGAIVIRCEQYGPLKATAEDSTYLYHKSHREPDLSDFFQPLEPGTDRAGTDTRFWHVISITDEGCGIPADSCDKIFYPFYTTKENGTGLGLSTVYKIIEEHGGKISVNSEVDRGTCITLYFPGYVPVQEELVL